MEDFEAVSKHGQRYIVPRTLSRAFAVSMKIKDDQNFPRAMDPHNAEHHSAEGWQGAYHVHFLEKIDTSGAVIGWELIWGQPKHTMRLFYDHVCQRWPELSEVRFDTTFCRALKEESKAKLRGFRAVKLSLGATRARLPLHPLPSDLSSTDLSSTLVCANVDAESVSRHASM